MGGKFMTGLKPGKTALLALVVLVGLLGFPRVVLSQENADKIKSVFMFKFFDYVTWPSGYVPGTSGDGILCTYGSHPFGETLTHLASLKSADHRFRVQSVSSVEQGKRCHVLYVAKSRYDKVPAFPSGSGVLIVGDDDGFLEAGGIIQMKEDKGKVRLMIDLNNAKKHGVQISSRLLNIAEVRK